MLGRKKEKEYGNDEDDTNYGDNNQDNDIENNNTYDNMENDDSCSSIENNINDFLLQADYRYLFDFMSLDVFQLCLFL